MTLIAIDMCGYMPQCIAHQQIHPPEPGQQERWNGRVRPESWCKLHNKYSDQSNMKLQCGADVRDVQEIQTLAEITVYFHAQLYQ